MLDIALRLALSPLLLAQGVSVRGRALRLPEAAGQRSGSLGNGPRLSLLIVGDSSAAGVGRASIAGVGRTIDHAFGAAVQR